MTHNKKHIQRLPVEIQPVIDDLEAAARPPDLISKSNTVRVRHGTQTKRRLRI